MLIWASGFCNSRLVSGIYSKSSQKELVLTSRNDGYLPFICSAIKICYMQAHEHLAFQLVSQIEYLTSERTSLGRAKV